MKTKRIAAITLIILLLSSAFTFGHSGRTDSSGGHKDNQNASGLGSYHYHCGGNPPHLHQGGTCPYSSSSSSSSSSTKSTSSSGSSAAVPAETYVSSIAFRSPPSNIKVEESVTLEYSLNPANAVNKNVTWTSSNEDVATVDSTGTVSAVGIGTTVITVHSDNGKTASHTITIEEILAEEIIIENELSSLRVEATAALKAKLLPDNTTDKTIEWSSSNPEVASIDENGLLEAVGPGKATITAIHRELTQSFDLTIEPNPAESVTIILSKTSNFRKGDSVVLEALIEPENTTYKDITWSVDNEDVAIIEGDMLTFIANGTAEVTAVTLDGVSDTVKLTANSVILDIVIIIVMIVFFGGIGYGIYRLIKKLRRIFISDNTFHSRKIR